MASEDQPPADNKRERLSKRVAEDIMSEIRGSGWIAGEMLGTEAELMARFAVSRATLAEAVRHLERHGAAAMIRGKFGGLRVVAPAGETIVRTVSTYLELADTKLEDVIEAWRVIEVHAAGAAARKISPDGLRRLGELVAAIQVERDPARVLALGAAFRAAIAHEAANPALALFMDALVQVLSRRDELADADPVPETVAGVRESLGRLADAVAMGDSALAQAIMLISVPPGSLAGISAVLLEPQNAKIYGSKEKLAEAVVRTIRADIAGRGWPSGERLGDEAGLLQRYGTSRWVLRQALRVLEAHSIVTAKPGFGGGWIIGRPDADYTVDLVVGYLRYADFTLENVADLWAHLIEHSIQLAGQRAAGTDFDPLLAITDRQAAAATGGEFRAATNRYYAMLGTLSGNAVISLIVTALGRFISQTRLKGDRTEIGRRLREAHLGVAEALREGRPGEARRLMSDYMQYSRPYYAQDPAVPIKA